MVLVSRVYCFENSLSIRKCLHVDNIPCLNIAISSGKIIFNIIGPFYHHHHDGGDDDNDDDNVVADVAIRVYENNLFFYFGKKEEEGKPPNINMDTVRCVYITFNNRYWFSVTEKVSIELTSSVGMSKRLTSLNGHSSEQ